jgi:hypothetical protein
MHHGRSLLRDELMLGQVGPVILVGSHSLGGKVLNLRHISPIVL